MGPWISTVAELKSRLKFFSLLAGSLLLTASAAPVHGQINYTTYHNDNLRSGQNLHETILAPAVVNSDSFGKLFAQPVDGQVYGSPLVVSNLVIPGKGPHNVVYAATENDSVYAFDANSNTGVNAAPLWHVNFTDPAKGITTIPSTDIGSIAISPQIGITSTPVINPVTETIYVVAATKENGAYVQRLHALDLMTGAEQFGGPIAISAWVKGSGANAVKGKIYFDPLYSNQRSALLLLNGVVYIGWSSHGLETIDAYHGWVIGYNATTLAQTAAFCVTPNGDQGGIWQSGNGLAADTIGNIYFLVGNGTFDASTSGNDFGMSFMKLSSTSSLKASDYFTPYNAVTESGKDLDLGSGGTLLLPYQTGATAPYLAVGAGKDGNIYLVNRQNMGHMNTAKNNSQIVQEIPNAFRGHGLWSSPAYWQGNLYFWGTYDNLRIFQLQNGLINKTPIAMSSFTMASPGATPVISSNGSANGIVWALDTSKPLTGPAVLHALDATSAVELYNSTQAGTRDTAGVALHFTIPTVVNGKVYVPTATELDVYGLLP